MGWKREMFLKDIIFVFLTCLELFLLVVLLAIPVAIFGYFYNFLKPVGEFVIAAGLFFLGVFLIYSLWTVLVNIFFLFFYFIIRVLFGKSGEEYVKKIFN